MGGPDGQIRRQPAGRAVGELFDIEVEFKNVAARAGLKSMASPSPTRPPTSRLTALGTAPPRGDGVLRLRLLVDRTSIETFADDGRVALSGCFLPPANNKSLEVFSESGAVTIRSLRVHTRRRLTLDVDD